MTTRWTKYKKLSGATVQTVALWLCYFTINFQLHSQERSILAVSNQVGPSPNNEQGILPNPSIQLAVGLPNALPTSSGGLLVQPHVYSGLGVELADPMGPEWLSSHRPSAVFRGDEQFFPLQEVVPAPAPEYFYQPSTALPLPPATAIPLFENLIESTPIQPTRPRRGKWLTCSESGLGRERLAFALFDIDPAQPFSNFRFRSVLGNRMRLPDRAEYFWAKTGSIKGPPLGESAIDFQEARMRMELGSKKFSTAVELPFRAVDPQFNENHAGLGDIQLITKTVLLDGSQWMLTQYFGTYFPSGNSGAGLGTGHFGLEPGLLFRNEFRESTWMHGDLKFWFPLGADPAHGGQVLKFATGLNSVWFETDHDAWLPSIELSTFSILNGMATDAAGFLRPIDGDAIVYVTPGIHYAVDNNGDFGLLEIGTSASLAVSKERFTDSTLTFEMRWSW